MSGIGTGFSKETALSERDTIVPVSIRFPLPVRARPRNAAGRKAERNRKAAERRELLLCLEPNSFGEVRRRESQFAGLDAPIAIIILNQNVK